MNVFSPLVGQVRKYRISPVDPDRSSQHEKQTRAPLSPIIILCSYLVEIEYNEYLQHLHKLWKMYASQETNNMGYEQLHEMFCVLCPGDTDTPTLEEICIFLGAVKRARSEALGSESDTSLGEGEFLEYMLRGIYQTRSSMQQFSSRSSMHRKIYRCIDAITFDSKNERQTLLARQLSAHSH